MLSKAGPGHCSFLLQEAHPGSQREFLTFRARTADRPNQARSPEVWGPKAGSAASRPGRALLEPFQARSLLKGRSGVRPEEPHCIGDRLLTLKSYHYTVSGHLGSIHSLCDTLICFPTGSKPLPSGPASPKRKLEAAEEPPGEELSKRARVAELPAGELTSRDV